MHTFAYVFRISSKDEPKVLFIPQRVYWIGHCRTQCLIAHRPQCNQQRGRTRQRECPPSDVHAIREVLQPIADRDVSYRPGDAARPNSPIQATIHRGTVHEGSPQPTNTYRETEHMFTKMFPELHVSDVERLSNSSRGPLDSRWASSSRTRGARFRSAQTRRLDAVSSSHAA